MTVSRIFDAGNKGALTVVRGAYVPGDARTDSSNNIAAGVERASP